MRDAWNKPLCWRVLLAALVLALLALRLSGPSNLEADAQDRNVGYVMDVVWQGHWLVQQDIRGRIMSKPPLHTWIAAAFAEIGGIDRFTLALPSALAVLAMALLVFEIGRRRHSLLAGGLAGLAVVLAPMMSKHVALVRTDALFALAVAAGAFAAHRAWARGGGWTPFWFWAAMATLIKGPLGLVLAAMGLAAWFWERRSDPATPPLAGAQWTGILLFLLLTLGWLLPAILSAGQPLIDKMFFEELIGQATGVGKGGFPGRNLPKPSLYFILRFLPFSLFAAYGLWRVVRQPAVDAAERRFERFLFCWIAGGIAVFSLGSHYRGDLLLPLWPAAALLAGREMARLAERIGRPLAGAVLAALTFIILAGNGWIYHGAAMRESEEVRYTVAAQRAARALSASGLDVRRLHHLDTPVTLQLGLGTFRPWIGEDEALRLAAGSEPALLAVEAPEDFPRLFGPAGPALNEKFRWQPDATGKAAVIVYANAAAEAQAARSPIR
ncbi:MAG: glycosyltransferase family 39 protein [Zoogloeaceae bacterium]|nr:glycosyltransferase family 39 protein [Zoogloeaceae bacterium]MBP9654381.1 glycosyltransferase family 39 protein [Rhodocyclaceae bacterium]MCZ2173044.1 glycosyltransferase family 39 protein [Burkholderiales bacterium]